MLSQDRYMAHVHLADMNKQLKPLSYINMQVKRYCEAPFTHTRLL